MSASSLGHFFAFENPNAINSPTESSVMSIYGRSVIQVSFSALDTAIRWKSLLNSAERGLLWTIIANNVGRFIGVGFCLGLPPVWRNQKSCSTGGWVIVRGVHGAGRECHASFLGSLVGIIGCLLQVGRYDTSLCCRRWQGFSHDLVAVHMFPGRGIHRKLPIISIFS